MSNKVPQRARITGCPHGGKHNGVDGYIVDTYADGTVAIDMGFNHTCITPGWDKLEPVNREDVHFNDDPNAQEARIDAPKRRGRPPKPKVLAVSTAEQKRRGRPPKARVVKTGTDEVPPACLRMTKQAALERLADDLAESTVTFPNHQSEVSTSENSKERKPLLTVTGIEGDLVSFTYRLGETSVEAVKVTKDDLVTLKTIISALTPKGGL